jgi:hypothetical protein
MISSPIPDTKSKKVTIEKIKFKRNENKRFSIK